MRKRAGAVLLSLWCGANLLVAAAVTATTLLGRAPPALRLVFGDAELAALDPRVVAVVRAQAALANPCIVALCVLVLALTWSGAVGGTRSASGAVGGTRSAWRALAGTLVPLQAFGFVSDGFLGARNLAANVASSALLVAALALLSSGSSNDRSPV